MRTSQLFIVALCAGLWLAGMQSAVATEDPQSSGLSAVARPDSRPAPTSAVEQFPRGTWIFQLDGTFIHPFSGERFEQFLGGQAGVGYYLFDRVSVNFDVPTYWVNQRGPTRSAAGLTF